MKFMINITFNVERPSEEMVALVPKEQAHISKLMGKGIVEAIYISADRLHIWLVMQGESQVQVEQELQSFPLYPYMRANFTLLM